MNTLPIQTTTIRLTPATMRQRWTMSANTETTSSKRVRSGSTAGWAAVVLGLWVLVTPFFWGVSTGGGAWGNIGSGVWSTVGAGAGGGGGALLYWSNIVSGIVIAILAGYAAQSGNSRAGWIASLFGLWVLVTPFFWGGVGAGAWWGGGAWLFWSNVFTGFAIAFLVGQTAESVSADAGSSTST